MQHGIRTSFSFWHPPLGVINEARRSQNTRVSPRAWHTLIGHRARCSEPAPGRKGSTAGSNRPQEDKEEKERYALCFLWFSPFKLKMWTKEGSMETLLFIPSFLFLGMLDGRLTPCLGLSSLKGTESPTLLQTSVSVEVWRATGTGEGPGAGGGISIARMLPAPGCLLAALAPASGLQIQMELLPCSRDVGRRLRTPSCRAGLG